ncbi:MAG: hypothetical protein JXA57_14560 [Armatimonadetes bacterium]|nr:hypothetical protein [Armatimonadota bacterium]
MSYETFRDLLGVEQGSECEGKNIDLSLQCIYQFASLVWEDKQLDIYTSHDVGHSERLVQRASQITSVVKQHLTPREKFVLGAAALVHDIGMQYGKWKLPGEPDYGDDEIRARHCELGARLWADTKNFAILQARGLARETPPQWASGLSYVPETVATVAFAHSDTDRWGRIEQLLVQTPPDSEGPDPLRVWFLAALLRISDELDCDKERVPDVGALEAARLPIDSKCHWLTCYYIEDVAISGNGGVNVKLIWRSRATEGRVEPVNSQWAHILLARYRLQSIKDEHYAVRKCLKPAVRATAIQLRAELAGEPVPFVGLRPVGDAIVDHLSHQWKALSREELRDLGLNTLRLPTGSKLEVIASEHAKRNAKEVHGRLDTGWHTDRYLDCGRLLRNVGFLRDLARLLASTYGDMGITDIVAVGKSARILVGLLGQFMTATTWFVGKPAPDPVRRVGDDLEIRRGSNVLIVDDILAVGGVAKELSDNVRARCQPASIRLFAIYALGASDITIANTEELSPTVLNINEDYSYYKEDKPDRRCNVCRPYPRRAVIDLENEWP